LAFEPILPTGATGGADDALFDVTPGVGATLPVIPLQTAAAAAPAAVSTGPAFLDLRDGDTLPMAQTTIRVQGRAGGALRLRVNGEEVPASRIGKRVTTADAGTEALEFIGVTLTPGTNELEIAQVDPFGNPRGATKIQVIAPDKLGQIKLTLPANEQPADGHTPARVEWSCSMQTASQ
jgi:hypothetical protein